MLTDSRGVLIEMASVFSWFCWSAECSCSIFEHSAPDLGMLELDAEPLFLFRRFLPLGLPGNTHCGSS